MANSAETTPCTPLCRHQRHQVTVNGNEYEHIWEAPFPVAVPVGTGPAVPEGRCTPTTLPRVSVANAHAAALAFSTFKAPDVIDGADSRTLPNPERPVYVSANDILRSPMTRRIIDKDGGKYSALEKVPSHHNVAPCSIIHANVWGHARARAGACVHHRRQQRHVIERFGTEFVYVGSIFLRHSTRPPRECMAAILQDIEAILV